MSDITIVQNGMLPAEMVLGQDNGPQKIFNVAGRTIIREFGQTYIEEPIEDNDEM